jgi:hypothetical protein
MVEAFWKQQQLHRPGGKDQAYETIIAVQIDIKHF